MKVSINLTIDIDPEIWTVNFGNAVTKAEVREDVKRYAEYIIKETIRDATGALIDKSAHE